MNILTVFLQMITLFLFVIIGVICSRTGIVDEKNAQCISRLIVQVFNPALIFSSVLNYGQNTDEYFIGTIVLIAISMFAAFIIIGNTTSRFFSKDKDEDKFYKLMNTFSNIGFIGIPLVSSLYGTSALIYVAVFILIYNILIYTYGVSILQDRRSKLLSISNLKSVLNMGTLSCCITLIVFYFRIPIHPILETTISYLGNVATPLALMSIGFSLNKANIYTVFTDKKLYLFSLMKLIILPAMGVVILNAIHIPEQILGVSVIMLSMPIGNMPVILASQYGINSDIGSKGIIITTLLSVITVPLIISMI